MPSFVDLPHRFTELYAMVSSGAADSADEATNSGAAEPTDDPAICLITGRVLAAGHKPAGNHNPGECTLHARRSVVGWLGRGVCCCDNPSDEFLYCPLLRVHPRS